MACLLEVLLVLSTNYLNIGVGNKLELMDIQWILAANQRINSSSSTITKVSIGTHVRVSQPLHGN